jgi:DNA-directed RNA polymerase subunit F
VINEKAYKKISDIVDYEEQWIRTIYKPINDMMNVVGWSSEKINKIDDICKGKAY